MAGAMEPASDGQSEIDGILMTVDDTTFSEDDWNDIVMATARLGSNWQKLVTNLGLPSHVIDSIKMEVSPSDSWSEALKRWIKQIYNTKRYGKPSWRTLLRAVAQVDKLLFKTLADKHKKIKASQANQELSLRLRRNVGMAGHIAPTGRQFYERIHCRNKGCTWENLYGKYIDHLQKCPFQEVQCKFCGEKCMRKDLDEHMNLKPAPEQLYMGCRKAKINCLLCKTQYQRQDLKAHLNENPSWDHRNEGCTRVRIKCKFCQKTFTRGNLKRHLNLHAVGEAQLKGCELVQLSCSYCKAPILRRELSFHLNLHPIEDKRSWEEGCAEAVIKCVFCNLPVKRAELGNHLNNNPTPENWLQGCDDADVKCIYCKEEYKRCQLRVKAKKMETQLNEKNLKAVVVTSSIAKEKWYEIGLELKVDAKELDQLKAKYKGSANECFYETIRIWLESKERKSWNTIVDALCRVGMQSEAKDVERSVICEDALMKTTGEYIKSTEAKIAKVRRLTERGEQLSKQYNKLKQQLKIQEECMTQLNADLDKLQKKFEEQAIANVAKELKATKSQIDACKKKFTKLEKERTSAREALRETLQNITACESELSTAKQDMQNCIEKLDHQSEDLIRERDLKLEHAEQKISNAKKWGMGGLGLLVVGGVTAAASVVSGPAAPVVLGVGLAIASVGAGTSAVATGVGIHFKYDYNKLNEEQKKICDDYAPVAENCSKMLDSGQKMAEKAHTLLEEMKNIAKMYEIYKNKS